MPLTIDIIHTDIHGPNAIVSNNLDRVIKQVKAAGFDGIGILEDQAVTMAGPMDARGTPELLKSVALINAATRAGLKVLWRWNGLMRYSVASEQPYWYPPLSCAQHIAYATSLVSNPGVTVIGNDLESNQPLARLAPFATPAIDGDKDFSMPQEGRGPILDFWNVVDRLVSASSKCRVGIQDLAIPMPGWEGRVWRDFYPNPDLGEKQSDPAGGLDKYEFAGIAETAPVAQADIAAMAAYARRRGVWVNLFHLTAAADAYWTLRGGFSGAVVAGVRAGAVGNS